MACGCQQNRWNPDSDLVPAEVGPNASGYFYGAVDDDEQPEPGVPKWNPDTGTDD